MASVVLICIGARLDSCSSQRKTRSQLLVLVGHLVDDGGHTGQQGEPGVVAAGDPVAEGLRAMPVVRVPQQREDLALLVVALP